MRDLAAAARTAWSLLEPIHAVTYFAPEPLSALAAAGYRGFWMGYFAGRAAPLGAVGPELTHAMFYNFSFERVSRALPAAWQFAPPETALSARVTGSVAALRRAMNDPDHPSIDRAAELASRAAQEAPPEGRPLFAANQALPEPAEPVARLWHAATLLREHRGDGHVAALVAAGVSGRESHVFHSLATGTPREIYRAARDITYEEWNELVDSLRSKGLASGDGLSSEGHRVKEWIERHTDASAASAYAALSAEELDELLGLLRPLTRRVIDAGDIPLDSPMGLDLRTVVD